MRGQGRKFVRLTTLVATAVACGGLPDRRGRREGIGAVALSRVFRLKTKGTRSVMGDERNSVKRETGDATTHSGVDVVLALTGRLTERVGHT